MRLDLDRNSCNEVYMPSQKRKIGPTRRSVSGVYAFRGERSLEFESTLERDFIIRTEFSVCVLDIIPQPVEIPFVAYNGRTYTYTPDFLVYYRVGSTTYNASLKPMLVEVKPEDKWKKNRREWLPKWKAAHRYALEQGWSFHLHDESRIRDLAFENIRFLERYKHMHFAPEESQWVIDNIRQMGSAPFHYILARHFMGIYKAEGIAHIWHLLATRVLDCDITRPLNDFTDLWVSSYE